MNICSLNARGLGDRKKRKSMFQFIRRYGADIVLMQEAHIKDMQQLKLWESEWGGPMYASCGESNSKGVLIMLSLKCGLQLKNVKTDHDGRIVCGQVIGEQCCFTLCNIYAPNVDDAEFFHELVRIMDDELYSESEGTVLGGDFNLVMQPKIDHNNLLHNHSNSLHVLNELMEQKGLADVWRVLNPEAKRFTWHRWSNHQSAASRIDMILIPIEWMDCVKDCAIKPGHLTDHSLVTVQIGIEEHKRGPGVWKFNNQLLGNDEFCVGVKDLLENLDMCCTHMDPCTKWECIKMELGYYSKHFAKKLCCNKRDKLDKL